MGLCCTKTRSDASSIHSGKQIAAVMAEKGMVAVMVMVAELGL
jgi:hypothetical protein